MDWLAGHHGCLSDAIPIQYRGLRHISVSDRREWDNVRMSEQKKSLPAWLLGLIIAVAVFVVGLILFQVLGFGDDPSFETGVTLLLW